MKNVCCNGGEAFQNALLALEYVLQGKWMKKRWCGHLKYFLVLPHVQEVRGCTCEPGGVPAVAGS